VSAFFQVSTLAALTLGGLFMTGLLPTDRLEPYLPFLRNDDSPFATEMGVTEPAGTSTGAVPDGYGTPSPDGASAQPAVTDPTRRKAPVPARPGCDAPSTVHRLASRYPGWSRADLALIACARVRRGFTAGQVRASRGEPDSVSEPSPGVQIWSYSAGDVTFAGGVVVAAQ
jgi:hypothetical protein